MPTPESHPGSSTATAATTSAASDENVAKLVDMGFTADQSRKALSMCDNNVDLAASLLFEKGGQV